MRVLVTGSTTWDDGEAIERELAQLPTDVVIVTGDTSGVDALAIEIGTKLGQTVEAMKKRNVDYRRYPGEGWKGLNERMVASGIDLVLAFHGELGVPGRARGTQHAITLAEQAGVPVRTFTR